jgi:hypothetical protein
MRRPYTSPTIATEHVFETAALACGKTDPPPPGSFHFTGYDVFTGHLGPGFGAGQSQSTTLSAWPGSPASNRYPYPGLCINWVTLAT